MTQNPLTHHEVLALAASFAPLGLQVDLAASQRQERQLLLRAREVDGAVHWLLQLRGASSVELTRVCPGPAGTTATLRGQGPDLASLLRRMQSVPLNIHVTQEEDFCVLRDYRLEAAGPVLARGQVLLPRLRFEMKVPELRRMAAELQLRPVDATHRPALPEDLLAVLGWHWARLVPDRQGWTTRLRLRAEGAERTQWAEAALLLAARQLARTLREPPQAYHARLRAARWGVFFRRGIPSFTALALVAAVLLTAALGFQPTATQMVLLYHLPTLVIAASFLMQELARFEWPPWPRPLSSTAW